ncbi:molybdopterin-dependent oxidoreductase [Brucepastera parasyntrophica]|uniref:xanthine dehydrogenase family protein molybdopterin-binding subunit n=1 Tax=Brucepastera parasyntrophica TaxID=2880008 RepID=UPI002109FDF1|nr:molybdopterin cofactor-binding domain-containing protein [Brucepastera parasyntrophica]ULQ60094.1 molybdopterin-dependent oxidoreductase [Brucepastera parasyntrophica]
MGPDPEIIRKIAQDIKIETEENRPFLFDDDFSEQQIIGKRIISSGNPDPVYARAKTKFETVTSIGPQDHFYAEPLCTTVNYSKEKIEIYTATQWPFHVRETVAAVLGLDNEKVRVIPTVTGEVLDGKIWTPSILSAQAALASYLCKKPVKISFSRSEDFYYTTKSAPIKITHKTAINSKGKIESIIIKILVNSGAYSPLIHEIIDRMAVSATGFYTAKNRKIEVYAVKTSMPPMDALAGFEESSVLFALENHLNEIIKKSGFSPVEWKLANLVSRGEKLFYGAIMETDYHFKDLFDSVCRASDFHRKYAAYSSLNKTRNGYGDGPFRGIGIACGFQGNGFISKTLNNSKYEVEMTMDTDGNVYIKSGFYSKSMKNILGAIVATSFGIGKELIYFAGTDTDDMSISGPETLSSKIAILAPLIIRCCSTIQKLRFRQPLPITVKKIYKPGKKEIWDFSQMTGKPFISLTPAVCVLEMELDPTAFEVHIRSVWLACDAGQIYNKQAAISTVNKTIAEAISKVSIEQIKITDGKFHPADGNLYNIISPVQVPKTHIIFADSAFVPRGLDSIAHTLIPAAYTTALAQITDSFTETIPVNAEMIFEKLESKFSQEPQEETAV